MHGTYLESLYAKQGVVRLKQCIVCRYMTTDPAPRGEILVRSSGLLPPPGHCTLTYSAFGDNRTSFRQLGWKTPIFYGREVQKTPNALYLTSMLTRAWAPFFLHESPSET
jgi:hypothetical protein